MYLKCLIFKSRVEEILFGIVCILSYFTACELWHVAHFNAIPCSVPLRVLKCKERRKYRKIEGKICNI